MGVPTPRERADAEKAAAQGNKLAQDMLKQWAKEEAKRRKKLAKKTKKDK